MSTLNVSNITDGTNSVETVYVARGSAKAWGNIDGTGTASIVEGFNTSSLTDNGVGNYSVSLTNAFSTATYSTGGFAQINVSSATQCYRVITNSASVVQLVNVSSSGGNIDTSENTFQAFGDLA